MEIKAVNWTHPTRYFFNRSTHMHTYIHKYAHIYKNTYIQTLKIYLQSAKNDDDDDDDDGIAAELILKFKTIIIYSCVQ